jgi:hypothetical protein
VVKDPNQDKVYNLNNVIREASRHFGKKEEHLRAKIDELETNSNMINTRDLYRGVNGIKKGGHPRTNIGKR